MGYKAWFQLLTFSVGQVKLTEFEILYFSTRIKMLKIISFVALVLLISSTEIFAQSDGNSDNSGDYLFPEVKISDFESDPFEKNSVSTVSEPASFWAQTFEPVGTNLDAAGIAELLSGSGWTPSVINQELKDIAGPFSLYSAALAPGRINYYVAPFDTTQPSLKLLQGGETETVVPIGFFSSDSSDKIKATIIEGMTSAIQGICELPGELIEIKAKASAAGIIEIEATWNAKGMCEEILAIE